MSPASADAGSNTPRPKSWDRRVGTETPFGYNAFGEYLALGPARSLRALTRILGKKSGYVRQLERWSSDHDWQNRAADYDQERISKALALQPLITQDAIARLAKHAAKASQVIVDIIDGDLGDDCEMIEIFGKHKEVIGYRPAVGPSARLQAAIRLHETIGIIPPKRVEHSGPDGEAIALANAYAQNLDPVLLDEIRALAARHAPTAEELAIAAKLADGAAHLEEL